MIKKVIKIILVLFVLLGIILSPQKVNAHSIEIDPESLISMPMMIWGGEGTITISNSVSNYTLYFQAVEIPSTVYSQIQKTEADGKADLNALKEEYTALKTTLDEASNAYQTGRTNNASETELETLRNAYEKASNNYQAKVTEYNNKVNEVNDRIKELTPTYVESNWIQAEDNKFSIDVTKFSGEQPYVIWVKLVTSNNTYYDEGIYTMKGTKTADISVKSVTIDKTSLSIEEGKSYTLTATITPEDATNKSLKWKSDNEKVATVSNGKVTGISEGTAIITVTTDDGDYTATCNVTVTKTSVKDDETVSTEKLPKTGVNMPLIITSISAISLFAILMYKKYNKYKNIK